MHEHDSTSKACWQTLKLCNYMKISLRSMFMAQVVDIAVMVGTQELLCCQRAFPGHSHCRVFLEASVICGLAGLRCILGKLGYGNVNWFFQKRWCIWECQLKKISKIEFEWNFNFLLE